jgi:hypothetical protein
LVQHVARLRNEPVADLHIHEHLLEALVWVVQVGATPRHEGMGVISFLIIPAALGIECHHVRKVEKYSTHTAPMGNGGSESPSRRFEAHRLIKSIQASVTVDGTSPRLLARRRNGLGRVRPSPAQ